MRLTAVLPTAILALALAAGAQADGLAVTPNISMPMGSGVDFTYRLAPHFNVRVGGAIPMTSEFEDLEIEDIKYDMKMKFGGFDAFVDWHPFAGNFHVSGGVTTARSPWTVEAASASTYKINGVSYAASDVGRLSGEFRIGNTVAPSVLIGWGNPVRPGKRWGAMIDLGLAYVGETDFVLNADGPIASEAAFRRDLLKEQERQSADHSFSLILKVGVSYQF